MIREIYNVLKSISKSIEPKPEKPITTRSFRMSNNLELWENIENIKSIQSLLIEDNKQK